MSNEMKLMIALMIVSWLAMIGIGVGIWVTATTYERDGRLSASLFIDALVYVLSTVISHSTSAWIAIQWHKRYDVVKQQLSI
jgi:hypothetical protein